MGHYVFEWLCREWVTPSLNDYVENGYTVFTDALSQGACFLVRVSEFLNDFASSVPLQNSLLQLFFPPSLVYLQCRSCGLNLEHFKVLLAWCRGFCVIVQGHRAIRLLSPSHRLRGLKWTMFAVIFFFFFLFLCRNSIPQNDSRSESGRSKRYTLRQDCLFLFPPLFLLSDWP